MAKKDRKKSRKRSIRMLLSMLTSVSLFSSSVSAAPYTPYTNTYSVTDQETGITYSDIYRCEDRDISEPMVFFRDVLESSSDPAHPNGRTYAQCWQAVMETILRDYIEDREMTKLYRLSDEETDPEIGNMIYSSSYEGALYSLARVLECPTQIHYDSWELSAKREYDSGPAFYYITPYRDVAEWDGHHDYFRYGYIFYNFELSFLDTDSLTTEFGSTATMDLDNPVTLKQLGIVERAGEEAYQHGVKNETTNTINVSQAISSTHQYSISNSVTNAETHTVSKTKKIIPKPTAGDIIKSGLDKLLGVLLESPDLHIFTNPEEDKTQTVTTTDTFTKTDGTTKTTSNSVTVNDTVSITLPPHTEASIKQTNYTKSPKLKYDYPVTISFDVEGWAQGMFYQPKTHKYSIELYRDIDFGNRDKDAYTDLVERYTYRDFPGYLENNTPFGLKTDFRSQVDHRELFSEQDLAPLFYVRPMSITGGVLSAETKTVVSTVVDPMPLYPLRQVTLADGKEKYFMSEGESLNLSTIQLNAFNSRSIPYYGFDPIKGHWEICDRNGNAIAASATHAVIKENTLNKNLYLSDTEKETVYVRYLIDENCYVSAANEKHCTTNAELDRNVIIEVSFTGHNWGEPEVTQTRTYCTDSEIVKYVCVDCGEIKEVTNPGLEHDMDLHISSTRHYFFCNNCSVRPYMMAHTYSDEDGCCTFCGYSPQVNITLNPGAGNGDEVEIETERMESYTLPGISETGFTAPNGKVFAGWQDEQGQIVDVIATNDYSMNSRYLTAVYKDGIKAAYVELLNDFDPADVFVFGNIYSSDAWMLGADYSIDSEDPDAFLVKNACLEYYDPSSDTYVGFEDPEYTNDKFTDTDYRIRIMLESTGDYVLSDDTLITYNGTKCKPVSDKTGTSAEKEYACYFHPKYEITLYDSRDTSVRSYVEYDNPEITLPECPDKILNNAPGLKFAGWQRYRSTDSTIYQPGDTFKLESLSDCKFMTCWETAQYPTPISTVKLTSADPAYGYTPDYCEQELKETWTVGAPALYRIERGAWYQDGKLMNTGRDAFQCDKEYTYKLEIRAQYPNPYIFDDTTAVYVNGKAVSASVTDDSFGLIVEYKYPVGAHVWDEGTVVQEPTESEPGMRGLTCTVCNATTISYFGGTEITASYYGSLLIATIQNPKTIMSYGFVVGDSSTVDLNTKGRMNFAYTEHTSEMTFRMSAKGLEGNYARAYVKYPNAFGEEIVTYSEPILLK